MRLKLSTKLAIVGVYLLLLSFSLEVYFGVLLFLDFYYFDPVLFFFVMMFCKFVAGLLLLNFFVSFLKAQRKGEARNEQRN